MSTPPLTSDQNHLIETHVALAQRIANRFWHKTGGAVEMDELLSVAYQGLTTAALRFDENYRPPNDPAYVPFLAFGPFARVRITGAIQDWLRAIDHVPRRQRKTYKDIRDLPQGRPVEETAAMLGISPDRVRAVVLAVESPPVSLESIEGDVSHHTGSNTETDAAARAIQRAMAACVSEMPSFKKSVVVMRYYLGLDFSRISAELGSSLSSVKVAHQEAVLDIHSVMLSAASF